MNKKSIPQEQEKEFRQSVCDIPGAVYKSKYNSQWEIEYISPTIEQMTGYPASDFIGNVVKKWTDIIHPDDKKMETEAVKTSLAEGIPYILEYRIIHSSGEVRWMYEKSQTEKTTEGQPFQKEGILLDITQGRLVNQNLQYLATHDSLTDLPNRALFFDRLKQALAKAKRTDQPLALFFIDLDNFKYINDTHGHGAGDAVLRSVAKNLKSSLRETDTIARLGGDEFIVLLENISDESHTPIVAQKINQAIATPVLLSTGESIKVTASIGISPYIKNDKADTLLQKADAAMYQAKKKGKSNFQIYAQTDPN